MIVAADLANFSEGLTHLASFIHLAQNHYPERLAFAVLSRPPTLFWLAWTAAQVCTCHVHIDIEVHAHGSRTSMTIKPCLGHKDFDTYSIHMHNNLLFVIRPWQLCRTADTVSCLIYRVNML